MFDLVTLDPSTSRPV